jgi:hypothetical protein
MTTEEKAKAYDDALEKAKGLFNSPRTCFDIDQLTDIFPELAESEDEKNIDTIFNCLYQCCDTGFISGTQRDNALAYLEKQKEQKSNFDTHWENGSMVCEQKEEKVEWSDEEKDKLNSIERLIVNANAHGNYLIGDKEATELQHFIRSIVKPIANIAEWSEEDEEALDMCLDAIPKAWKTKSGILLTKWLKEHFRPSWKPSEDQMRCLDMVLCDEAMDDNVHRVLVQLREQLKRLKGGVVPMKEIDE